MFKNSDHVTISNIKHLLIILMNSKYKSAQFKLKFE